MRRALLAATFAAAMAIAPFAAADPARIVIVEPAHPDATVREAVTRLGAELTAAGFVVTHVEAESGVDPRASVESAATASRPAATVAVLHTDRGAAVDVWVADHVTHKTIVRRVDTGTTGEAGLPATLAIRTVEVLRISLLEVSARPAPEPSASSRAPDRASPTFTFAAPPKAPPSRALFERLSFELGFAAVSGLAENGSRIAPTLRIAYGAAAGLAGRLTVIGPTANDQLGMIEAVYGFNRSFRTLAPILSLGAGAAHTFIDGSGGPERLRTRTQAWSAVLGGSAGVAARASDRAAIAFDTHLLCAIPTPSALVDTVPAAGKPQILVIASLGVVAGF
ncbi:Flagellar hook-length control protein FliK [Minicystis rosea]|nr:Flagellar hook-length control protein FliK [Minicystis rosea]